MIHVKRSGQPVTLESIAVIESELNRRIPDELKTFILAHNDAVPLHQRFNYSDSIGPGIGSFARVVSFDPAIDENAKSIALETEGFPHDCVPFGDSGHGDYVCVRVTSAKRMKSFCGVMSLSTGRKT